MVPFDDLNMCRRTVSIAEAIERLWWEELTDRFGGWEINEGGEGVLELDVASGEVGVWHTQHPVSDGPDGEEW